jgi:hypothetical protein
MVLRISCFRKIAIFVVLISLTIPSHFLLPATLPESIGQGLPERRQWRVVVDEKRTLQLPEIPLLIKIYRKRSMGWQISLDKPINTCLPYKKGVLSIRHEKTYD